MCTVYNYNLYTSQRLSRLRYPTHSQSLPTQFTQSCSLYGPHTGVVSQSIRSDRAIRSRSDPGIPGVGIRLTQRPSSENGDRLKRRPRRPPRARVVRRPLRSRTDPDGGAPLPYDRPHFVPWSDLDPEMDAAADALAREQGISREAQDAWACESHAKARAADLSPEIVPLAELGHVEGAEEAASHSSGRVELLRERPPP